MTDETPSSNTTIKKPFYTSLLNTIFQGPSTVFSSIMSNIGHETAPPGSWPRPGEEAISEPGHKDVRETTPRFQPCMPESFDDTDSGPVDESQGSEGYTHTETETGKDTEATKPMKMGDEFPLHPAEEKPEMAEREKTEMLVKDKEKGPEMTQAGKEEMSEKKPETTVKENEEELGVKTTEQESGEKAMEERGEGLGMEKVGKEKMGGSDEMKDEGEPVGMKKPGEEDSSEMAPKKEGKDSSTKPEDEKMGETEKAKPEEEALGSKKPGEKGLGDMSMEEKGKGLGMEKVGEEMGAKPKEEIPEGEQAKEEIKKDEGEQAKEEIKEDEGEKEEVESPEEKEKREQAEADRKLASQMATVIEQCLDRIRPVCKTITGVSRLIPTSASMLTSSQSDSPFPRKSIKHWQPTRTSAMKKRLSAKSVP
jgi:hypothetical protein